ncbi:MAG: CsgG/HfaB family protein [Gemmatimonadaceae bacterium]
MAPTFRRATLALLALAASAAPRLAAQDTRPTVAVLYFDNNSIGKDRGDYDGIGKGIADLLITQLGQVANVRVVERDRIQAILQEQNLTRMGQIDPATAMKMGKLLQAHYTIVGGFMNDGRGSIVLTSRVYSNETSVVSNPQKVQAKTDDVLGVIDQLAQRITADLKLPALRVAQAGEEKKHEGHDMKAEAKKESKPAKAEAKPTVAKAAPAPAKAAGKMDLRTALLYSKALDAEDRGAKGEAVELYRAVYAKFPDTRVKAKLAKLGA